MPNQAALIISFLSHSWSKDTPIDLVMEKAYDEKAGIGMADL
jgi:hypothetical protein